MPGYTCLRCGKRFGGKDETDEPKFCPTCRTFLIYGGDDLPPATVQAIVKAYAALLAEHDSLKAKFEKEAELKEAAWAKCRDLDRMIVERTEGMRRRLGILEEKVCALRIKIGEEPEEEE